MKPKNEEHYVDNEEFQNLLYDNKKLIKEYFKMELQSDEFFDYIDEHLEKYDYEKAMIKMRKSKKFMDMISEDKQPKLKEILVLEKELEESQEKNIDVTIGLKIIKLLSEEQVSQIKDELRLKEIEKRTNKKLIMLIRQPDIKLHQSKLYIRIQNKIGKIFISIAKGVLTQPNLINYTWDRKDDMMSEATFHMSRYMLLYDVRMTNPFAYFTTMCNRAFWQCINKQKKYSDSFQPLEYIENIHKEDNNFNETLEDWG